MTDPYPGRVELDRGTSSFSYVGGASANVKPRLRSHDLKSRTEGATTPMAIATGLTAATDILVHLDPAALMGKVSKVR